MWIIACPRGEPLRTRRAVRLSKTLKPFRFATLTRLMLDFQSPHETHRHSLQKHLKGIVMKNKIGKFSLALAAAALVLPVAPAPVAHAQDGGADFTKIVALGDSLTAGFQSGALHANGQQHGYVPLVAASVG